MSPEFGFTDLLKHTHVIIASVAPTPQGYVARAVAKEIPSIPLTFAVTALLGDPAQANETELAQVPMFTNPADCRGKSLTTTLYMDSWKNPGRSTRMAARMSKARAGPRRRMCLRR